MTGTTAVSERRELERRAEGNKTDVLINDAGRVLTACGVQRSHAWVRRTVRDFQRSAVNGLPFGLYLASRVELNAQQRTALAARDDLRYLLGYADPTGETAVRNVMREAR